MKFPAPTDDKEIEIHHGEIHHNKLDARKCEKCQEMLKQFQKAINTGEIQEILTQMGMQEKIVQMGS